MKQAYDEKGVGREFKPGEMVLLHTHCLSGKLDSIWEGPYEVEKVISATSYKLSVPDKRSHTIVVHINRLKPWKTHTANLFRVVVAEESEGTSEPLGKVKMGNPYCQNIKRWSCRSSWMDTS